MSSIKKEYNTVVSQARKGVPGFAIAYAKFIEKVTINQSSKSLIVNYSRSLAYIAMHFSRPPHQVSTDEINAYLYSMMVHEKCSITYFKHAVFAMRYWFRLFDMEEKAIQMPPVKKEKKLPTILSRQVQLIKTGSISNEIQNSRRTNSEQQIIYSHQTLTYSS